VVQVNERPVDSSVFMLLKAWWICRGVPSGTSLKRVLETLNVISAAVASFIPFKNMLKGLLKFTNQMMTIWWYDTGTGDTGRDRKKKEYLVTRSGKNEKLLLYSTVFLLVLWIIKNVGYNALNNNTPFSPSWDHSIIWFL